MKVEADMQIANISVKSVNYKTGEVIVKTAEVPFDRFDENGRAKVEDDEWKEERYFEEVE